jgi:hypothetical protein
LEMRKAYQATVLSISCLKHLALNGSEWNKIEQLIKLLNLFREATEMISTEQSPTLSSTSSIYQVLCDHLQESLNCQSDNDWYVVAIKAGQAKLHKYYPTSDGLAYIVSTGNTIN